MVELSEDVHSLFKDAILEISESSKSLMVNLWTKWSHLGIDEDEKVTYISKLIKIEKDLHEEVKLETEKKLKKMKDEVEELKQEIEELRKRLSLDITVPEYKEEKLLFSYIQELKEQISGYREQVRVRRSEIECLSQWQHDLAENLGATIQEIPEMPLPSEEELAKLKARLVALQAERDKRMETFLCTQREVKDIMDKLQIQPQSEFEAMVVSDLSVDFKVTDLNMDRLAKMQQELQEKYEQTNRESVASIRTKIKLMWENLMYSQQQREEFIHYYRDRFTEDTLTIHELYLEKITAFYNEHKQIFDLVQTRKNLWMKMTELESRATEPGHNRGGQLLEEKKWKTIAVGLQKIEEQLRELVTAYEARTNTTFTVEGKPLLQLIADEWEARKALEDSEECDSDTPSSDRSLVEVDEKLVIELEDSEECDSDTPSSDRSLVEVDEKLVAELEDSEECDSDTPSSDRSLVEVDEKLVAELEDSEECDSDTPSSDRSLGEVDEKLVAEWTNMARRAAIGALTPGGGAATPGIVTPGTPHARSLAASQLGKRNRTAAGLPLTADRIRPTKRALVRWPTLSSPTTSNGTSSPPLRGTMEMNKLGNKE